MKTPAKKTDSKRIDHSPATPESSSAGGLQLESPLHLLKHHHSYLEERRILLLEQIGATGSITKAAVAAGVSYKTAWDSLNSVH